VPLSPLSFLVPDDLAAAAAAEHLRKARPGVAAGEQPCICAVTSLSAQYVLSGAAAAVMLWFTVCVKLAP
jgi:hypothetical protein